MEEISSIVEKAIDYVFLQNKFTLNLYEFLKSNKATKKQTQDFIVSICAANLNNIIMDLDDGSLLNEGRDEPGWEKPNVICGKEEDGKCMLEYYATKDIKKGEELLCDYREFAWLDSWTDMGL